jgi:hypothetical protein
VKSHEGWRSMCHAGPRIGFTGCSEACRIQIGRIGHERLLSAFTIPQCQNQESGTDTATTITDIRRISHLLRRHPNSQFLIPNS